MKLPSIRRRSAPSFRCKDIHGRAVAVSAGTVDLDGVAYPVIGLSKGSSRKSQDGVQRAVGAASGAAIGLFFSPLGAAIGAGIGATFAGTTRIPVSILTGLSGPIIDIEISPSDLKTIELAAGRHAY